MELKDEESCCHLSFQSTLVCNRYLPYHSALLDEAAELLADIKLNLSIAVQKHELWPGALYWTNRLSRWAADLSGCGIDSSGCGIDSSGCGIDSSGCGWEVEVLPVGVLLGKFSGRVLSIIFVC
jgi:hypothetical protein